MKMQVNHKWQLLVRRLSLKFRIETIERHWDAIQRAYVKRDPSDI
jgi:hypothetical protein